MRWLFLLILPFVLNACSSSAPAPRESNGPIATQEKSTSTAKPTKSAPASIKPMKCTYDTDCMVQNSCVNEKCKLTGNECRFRSDCPSPRGVCVNKMCQFN